MLHIARPSRALHAAPVWVLVAAAVLVQIVYPLVPAAGRTPVTILSVVVFAAAALADAVRVHGPRGGAVLLAVAGGGGWVAEVVGLHTGLPFGGYTYTGTLGPELLGVPLVVPLAWTMMAWPALAVGRALARRPLTVAVTGGWALAAWDVFLDPQMVDAGYWRWADPHPALPLVPGIPVSNYAGWLLVAMLMTAALHRALPREVRTSGPAAALYLWAYGSSVLAHLAFFARPGSAVLGAVLMGLVALPFARIASRDRHGSMGLVHPGDQGHPGPADARPTASGCGTRHHGEG